MTARTGNRSLGPAHYLFAGVFLVRLIALARLTVSPMLLPSRGDMHFYNDWARRIMDGQWTDHFAFYGLPGYAYLLAGIYKLFGYSPFLPALAQACLDAGTAVLIYQISRLIFVNSASQHEDGTNQPGATILAPTLTGRPGEVIGMVAALGWAFFQPATAYSIILMPTAWLVFVFWFLVWQIVKRNEAPRLSGWLWLGLLIGFTAQGIATILFLLPLLLLACFTKWKCQPRDQTRLWMRLAAVAVLFLGVGLGTSPSWLHNYVVARDPVVLSAHSGVNFWIGNNPWATGYPRFPPGLHAGQEAMLKDSITEAEKEAGRPLKRSEVSVYWTAKAHDYIRHHFGDWLKLLGTKIANFWNAFQYDDLSIITMLREEGVIFPGLKFGLVAALAFPGMVLAWGKFPLSRWVAGAVLLHMISLLSVFVTERYRLAVVPGLLLFAGVGLWELWNALARANYGRSALYLGSLALSTFLVSMPKADASLWSLDSYNSGIQALEIEQFAVAEQKLQLAYAYSPGNSELNFALGNLHYARGDKEQAGSWYNRALGLNSHHEGALNNLGVLALEKQQWEVAIKFFERALAITPDDAKTHYLLARAELAAGDRQAARAEIAKAIELRPAQPEFLKLQEDLAEDAPE